MKNFLIVLLVLGAAVGGFFFSCTEKGKELAAKCQFSKKPDAGTDPKKPETKTP